MPNCSSCNSTVSPGTAYCRSCGASIPEPTTLTGDLEREVRSLLDQRKKIEAVKVYKDHTGSPDNRRHFIVKHDHDAVPTLSLDRYAPIHVPVRLRRLFQVKLIQFDGLKRLVHHQFPDVPNQLTVFAQ